MSRLTHFQPLRPSRAKGAVSLSVLPADHHGKTPAGLVGCLGRAGTRKPALGMWPQRAHSPDRPGPVTSRVRQSGLLALRVEDRAQRGGEFWQLLGGGGVED